MNMIKKFCNAIDWLNERVGRGVAWVTTALVAVVFVDVVMRYLFNTSYVFTQELEWQLFAFIFLMGAGYTLLHDGHVRVDIILHDNRMGFYQAAKYYYYPGWHEPGTYLEYFFNKKAYESLPKDLQAILDTACMANELWCLAQFDARNGAALVELLTKHKVQLLKYPDSVMKALRKLSKEVVAEQAAKDAMSKKVAAGFAAFQKQVGPWYTVSEKAYYNDIFGDYSLKG